MALSNALKNALAGGSSVEANSSIQTQITNAQNRLGSVGVSSQQAKPKSNLLLDLLGILSAPGYGATNAIREFTNPGYGSTPGKFDPGAAFFRGLMGDEQPTGKDVMLDVGVDDTKPIFGGEEAKWYNPTAAGLGGFALDVFNPLDPLNWLSFGTGGAIEKGLSTGTKALTSAFGSKGDEIAKILMSVAGKADDVVDASKTVDTIVDAARGAGYLDDLGAPTVGKLVEQIKIKASDLDNFDDIAKLIEDGMKETGLTATSKLDFKSMKPISVGLQNPLSITQTGAALKLPTYKSTGARLPILNIGKDLPSTFVNIPGSEHLTYAVGSIVRKVADTKVGQALGRAFSTVFVPNTVPSSVVKRDMTAANIQDLVNISQTRPQDVPLTAEELVNLQAELANIKVGTQFDYHDILKTEALRDVNKGNYLSLENLAKSAGMKGFTVDDIAELLSDTPFSKNITEIYDSLRMLKPLDDTKQLFTQAVRLRKAMDLLYDQIPEGLKPYFTGVLKPQKANLYPTDIASHRLGKNVAKSPLLAYEFNYKGVPVSVVTNSGQNFNVDAWAKLATTMEALDELPEEAIQAIKGQVEISAIPIKSPDTSMTVGDTIVLGRIDKPTVAHEFGHIWDNLKGDTTKYSQSILGDAGKIDGTIDTNDLYSDYSRALYDPTNDVGLKEDLADALSDYLKDPKSFRRDYSNRANYIEELLANVSDKEALARSVTEQRKLAKQISEIPRTEQQISDVLKEIDQYASKLTFESGDKAYTAFRKNFHEMFETVNFRAKEWKAQVEAIFHDVPLSERKQIMDVAAQITGTDIPGKAVAEADALFSQQNYPVFYSKLKETTDGMPNSMPVEQFRKYLENKGVKREELKWSFIDDLLDGKTKVTKQEVQDWVAGNSLEVNEVWRTDDGKINFRAIQEAIELNETSWDHISDGINEAIEYGDSPATIVSQLQEAFDLNRREAQAMFDNVDNPGFIYEDTSHSTNNTKFSQYTQPGGEGYTELIFTLPQDYARPKTKAMPAMNALEVEYGDLASRIDDIAEELGRDSQEYLTMDRRLQELEAQGISTTPVEAEPSFTYTPHWDENNPVAHTRFDTRYTEDGKKVLFIDEIQSDWHQQGRDRGYRDLNWKSFNQLVEDAGSEFQKAGIALDHSFGTYDRPPEFGIRKWGTQESLSPDDLPPELRAIWDELDTRRHTAMEETSRIIGKSNAVADAPFKATWDEYVEKRLLRYAADNGYDGIAWSTGRQQADRWGQAVTDQIDTIQYWPESNSLDLYKNGESVQHMNLDGQDLKDIVGADIARQLMDETPAQYHIEPVDKNPSTSDLVNRVPEDLDPIQMMRWMDQQPEIQALRPVDGSAGAPSGYKVVDQNGNAWGYVYHSPEAAQKAIDDLATSGQTVRTVSGANITVGGEGMRKFYDQQIPSNFRRLGKKFGLQVNDIELGLGKPSVNEWMLEDIVGNGREVEYVFSHNRTGETRFVIAGNEREALSRLADQLADSGESPTMIQKGIWLSPESRTKITQQSFPLFMNPETPHLQDPLTQGWSERQINALDNLLKWRNSMVKQLRQAGIPINELEKYVPFIPTRPLRKDEAEVLRTVFGTGVKDAHQDNFDTLLMALQKQDPNLKQRTTKATRPAEVNALLKKDWLTEDAAVAMTIRGTRAIKAEEFTRFADEFIDTYGLRTQDLGQLGNVPEGYAAYQVGRDLEGHKIFKEIGSIPAATEADIDTVFLPKEMVSLFNEYTDLAFNKNKQNALLNIVDSVNRLYKKTAYLWNPGHIMRDFQGNVFNNFLMGVVNPSDYMDGFKVVRQMDGVLDTPTGSYSYKEIYEKAQQMGIIDSQLANELPNLSGKRESKYSNLMRNATYATDGFTRATGFVYNLKKGMNFSEAAAQTKKFLFDYMDLTAFERKVMKRVFPFYTWLRKNIPLQISMLLKSPRTYARINDTQNYIAGGPIDWDSKPEYIRDSMAIQPQGSDKYVNLNLPFTDIGRVPVNLNSLGNLMSSTTPLIQTPVESITNQDWFTGRPLENYEGEQTSAVLLDTLAKLLGAPTNEDGIAVPVDARVTGNIQKSIPILSRLDNLLATLSGQETSQAKNLSRVSSTLGGPSFYDASSVQASADRELRDRLVALIQRLNAQGYDVPTTQELKQSTSQSSRFERIKNIIAGG